ncbi:unnamed protein product [Strongylus vulgaris]|uniref:Ig-like domain-containing protein n=1 Tax=Strongylus vulgaris TaxID=40348 RepID=A0A3P7JTW3_STRVU|nr:unnamed protein product [Strongylus vulgaris]
MRTLFTAELTFLHRQPSHSCVRSPVQEGDRYLYKKCCSIQGKGGGKAWDGEGTGMGSSPCAPRLISHAPAEVFFHTRADADYVVLPCSAEGNPSPEITWFKNDIDVVSYLLIILVDIRTQKLRQCLQLQKKSCPAKENA